MVDATFTENENEHNITLFQEMIKFKTISGEGPTNGSYDECGQWILNELRLIEFNPQILIESISHKPIIVGSWLGSNPEIPAIILNSHYDVVPVFNDLWTFPSFEGTRINGRIYGRGTQDMYVIYLK
jgi:acetylornithine deacetylase/succinyl-diaminopimelate desuccinylase-like protein